MWRYVEVPNRKILLVEGNDDEHVLKHICGNRGIPILDQVIPHDGDRDLLKSLSSRLQFSQEGDSIGVVIDADTNLDARWQSIGDRLVKAGYTTVPEKPGLHGTILDPPGGTLLPKAGIWIMPDNRTSGILENFLHFLIPQPNELLEHATACVESIANPLFNQNDKPKAIMHTWLAWQEEPGKPYGTAITARYLNPTVPQVDVLVSWLIRLFVEEGP